MDKYSKIQSVFKRDPENNYQFTDEYSHPLFGYLEKNAWVWTEKVDGRNHRIIWDGEQVEHRGKTDNAHMPDFLLEDMNQIVDEDKFKETFGDTDVTLYGEAYGAKIQGGEHYIEDHRSFILFDILINGYWLERNDVEDIADKLNIDVVPIFGAGTIEQAIYYVRKGFDSLIADTQAEGLILFPKRQIFDRHGERVITKLKHKDFK